MRQQSIDPLASLPQMQAALHQRLRELTPTPAAELAAAWQAARAGGRGQAAAGADKAGAAAAGAVFGVGDVSG